MRTFKAIEERQGLKPEEFFNSTLPTNKPVVYRGFANDWPLVTAGKKSSTAFIDFLKLFDLGEKITMKVAPPKANKRFFYNDDLTGLNFLSGEEQFDLFLNRLLDLSDKDLYPALKMLGAPIHAILPRIMGHNESDICANIGPWLSIGNETIETTQYEGSDQLMCLVAGRCRIVLFPPEQTKNLYPGPLNYTPAGNPVSLVDLNHPEPDQFPLFEHALEHAYSVELLPGDAIFIPMLWWRQVESLEKLNAMLSYRCGDAPIEVNELPSAMDSLNLALLAMRDLNRQQRQSWRHIFDHYLFKQGIEPTSYIPVHQHHLLGKLSDDYVEKAKQYLVEKLG